MTDIADQAQAYESLDLRNALDSHAARAASAPRLAPVGYCHNHACGEDFDAGDPRLFCGPRCADEYDRRTQRR